MLIEGFFIWCYKKRIFSLGHFSTFKSNQQFFLLYFFYLLFLPNNLSNLLYFSLISLFSYSLSHLFLSSQLLFTTKQNVTASRLKNCSSITNLRKLLLTHLVWLRNTCKGRKCPSAVNCRIMKPAAVDYRGKLRQ